VIRGGDVERVMRDVVSVAEEHGHQTFREVLEREGVEWNEVWRVFERELDPAHFEHPAALAQLAMSCMLIGLRLAREVSDSEEAAA
jgi:hypothetical protein